MNISHPPPLIDDEKIIEDKQLEIYNCFFVAGAGGSFDRRGKLG